MNARHWIKVLLEQMHILHVLELDLYFVIQII